MDTSEYVPAQYCSKCGELKPLTEYYFRNDTGQYRTNCKDCARKQKREYYINNREYICHRNLQYYYDNREYCREKNRRYFQNNKERINEYYRNRYHTNDAFRITFLLRGRLRHAMNSQGAAKHDNTMNLVGCTPEWLTAWLNFTESIYCINEELTHIDHVIPISAYDLFYPFEQQKAMNWMNLIVIPAELNQRKSNTMPSFAEINEHQQLINSFITYMPNSH